MFILVVAAWWLWHLEQSETQSRLVRTVDLLREQSLRTFELQDALLIAVQGYTAAMSWDEIAKSSLSCKFPARTGRRYP